MKKVTPIFQNIMLLVSVKEVLETVEHEKNICNEIKTVKF